MLFASDGILPAHEPAMKTFICWSTKLLTVSWLLVMVYTASDIYAAPKPKVPVKTPYIEITAVDTTAMTITTAAKNSMDSATHTYKVTTTTVVKVNGTPATLADLKPDMQIHFTLAADGITATELSGSPAPRE